MCIQRLETLEYWVEFLKLKIFMYNYEKITEYESVSCV